MIKNIYKYLIIGILIFLFGKETHLMGQCQPYIKVDGNLVLANESVPDGLVLPLWLKENQTIEPAQMVNSISVIEFNIVNNSSLEFSQVLNIKSLSTVPTNKVWKVESIIKNPSFITSDGITFSSVGTRTFVVPQCASYICIEAWGGGGGGGGGGSSGGGGGGGGGGGYAQQCYTVTPGISLTITVGGGGNGGSGGSSGSNGGTTSVTGTGISLVANGGNGGGVGPNGTAGSGGSATGYIVVNGSNGVVGGPSGNPAVGGAGGEGGNGGLGGAGGSGSSPTGAAGNGPGGGGGGGGYYNSGYTGGKGAAGMVKIRW
ncbi:MAG TPA: hypothetical protein P5250_03095 [Bacteroidales bacterium]|nr:hypothetical protein [Bacteroidales bacterium]